MATVVCFSVQTGRGYHVDLGLPRVAMIFSKILLLKFEFLYTKTDIHIVFAQRPNFVLPVAAIVTITSYGATPTSVSKACS